MNQHPKKIVLEPLEMALRLEEEGQKFFEEAAGRVRNPHARKTLLFLAEEELRHIQKIKEFSRSVEAGAAAPKIEVTESIESRVKKFNDHLATLKADISPSASDIEAYTMAVKFENGAAEFYQEQKDRSDNPDVKAFYQWLIEEESLHSRVISSCLQFIQDPASWFADHKS